jgi:hypothetical protein
LVYAGGLHRPPDFTKNPTSKKSAGDWDKGYPSASTAIATPNPSVSPRLFPSRINLLRKKKTLAAEKNVKRYKMRRKKMFGLVDWP